MCLLINRRTAGDEPRALTFVAPYVLQITRWTFLFATVFLSSCSQKRAVSSKTFYDIDSLISAQQKMLQSSNYRLMKSVEIDGQKDQTTFNPDSLQWTHELDIFRQLDQINKGSFRDAYVTTDSRDPNSNLTIRELKANRPAPVSLVRFYFLGTLRDLRKIEGTLTEENALYVNDRRIVMEIDDRHLVNNYRVEGTQKMVMSDSVRFVIAGEVGIN
jgi:hypothetical protein